MLTRSIRTSGGVGLITYHDHGRPRSGTPAEFMRLQATMWRHLPASTMQRLEDEGALKAGKFVDERQSHDAVNSFVKENLLS